MINLIYAKWLFAFSAKILIALFVLLAIYLFYAAARPIGYGPLPPSFLPDIARASAGFIAGLLIYRAHSAGLLIGVPRLAPGIVYSAWFLICAMPTKHPMPMLEIAISLAVAPILVTLLVRGERPVPRPLMVLGALSYPLYASHFAIVNMASVWLGISQARHSPFLAVPMLAAALLLAFCIDRSLQLVFRERTQYSTGR